MSSIIRTPVDLTVAAQEMMAHFPKGQGAFLTTGKDKPNTMIISWGGIGFFWGSPVFETVVRFSRHSFPLLQEWEEFTISFPDFPLGDLANAYQVSGSQSGRDIDKFAQLGLTALPGQNVSVPVIGQCHLHLECKGVYKSTVDQAILAPEAPGLLRLALT